MSNKQSLFGYRGQQQATPTAPKGDPWKSPMPTFFAVEEPFVVNDTIPSAMQKTMSMQSTDGKQPTEVRLGTFPTKIAAITYAQSLNRPLVILEISTVHKIIPVKPEVVAYEPPKVEAVAKIDDTAPAFSNKG